ncbi:hypothetical protein [Synechococcus sp. PCC 6312]|uniref:hypothetical protein n=1 Tax=Synechococcus sp. (strain ATCC 27167 / PCC 6312) TaxID=195253 RepID=UPI00029ED349|nr:hypothetical protein [Synechococcus sp. PCC 6312]AFY62510.1 hypothetical protein Syn6312_3483 [Synechococcus sp. PCC 6312]
MARQIWISTAKLIETLRISEKQLMEIEEFFDADPYDKWNLEEGKDYRVINKTRGLREYTDTGAYAIASYLEEKHRAENKGFMGWLKEFIRKLKGDVRKTFVKEKILYNTSSLVKRNNIYLIDERDTVAIFGTRRDYLRKIFQLAQREENPLLPNQDYDDSLKEGIRYYSLSGFLKLSRVFHKELTNKNRKEWCLDAGSSIPSHVSEIIKLIEDRKKRIDKAKSLAENRDGHKCKVTGQKRSDSKINEIQLHGHHLFSAAYYPHLADSVENIITLKKEVHDDFHQVMGGKGKPCTIDDFIHYVKDHYPEKLELITWLHGQKAKIPSTIIPKDAPMVLYLPPSRVMQNN